MQFRNNKLFLKSQKGHTQQINKTILQNIFIKKGKDLLDRGLLNKFNTIGFTPKSIFKLKL